MTPFRRYEERDGKKEDVVRLVVAEPNIAITLFVFYMTELILRDFNTTGNVEAILNDLEGRPCGTVGKASASEARGPGFDPPWLVQRSRWESQPLALVGHGAGAVTHATDRAGTVFPRGTGRFLVKKSVLMYPFAVLAMKHSVRFFKGLNYQFAKYWVDTAI